MKICILSCFGDLLLKDTGPSVRIHHLAKNLASLGHEVHIIIPSDKMKTKYVDGIIVHGIRGFCPSVILKVFNRLLGVLRFKSFFFYDFLFILRATQIMRKADVVQIEQQSAGALFIVITTRFLKKPLVLDCHDTFQALRVGHTSTIRKILETFLEKMAYKYADAVLTVSEREKKWLIAYGIQHRNIEVIPNGVDTEAFNSLLDVTKFQGQYKSRNFHTVIFVGNMEYLPNQEAVQAIASDIAPEVQKEIDSAKFLIVGRITPELESSKLTFMGSVSHDSVPDFLANSDVAIAPLFNGSGTSLKVLEYFSCGLPVVSTTIGVEGLDVKDGVHALIEDDMNQFAIEVIKLLKDRKSSATLGKAARELVVNRYDWKKIADKLNVVYHNLLLGLATKSKDAVTKSFDHAVE